LVRFGLVLQQVSDASYRRLKAVVAAHRRSMNQEAILALEAGLPGVPAQPRPSPEQTRRWLEQQVWTLPLLDPRGADAILGSVVPNSRRWRPRPAPKSSTGPG
jgi:hypothetical protein